jgi:hypothetical protein
MVLIFLIIPENAGLILTIADCTQAEPFGSLDGV